MLSKKSEKWSMRLSSQIKKLLLNTSNSYQYYNGAWNKQFALVALFTPLLPDLLLLIFFWRTFPSLKELWYLSTVFPINTILNITRIQINSGLRDGNHSAKTTLHRHCLPFRKVLEVVWERSYLCCNFRYLW